MKIEQTRWSATEGWEPCEPSKLKDTADLLLIFGSTEILQDKAKASQVKDYYPNAVYMGCSTAGEIFKTEVTDDALTVTAIEFEHSTIQTNDLKIEDVENSYIAGQQLASGLEKEGLCHVFVLSDGLKVNGSELVKGITSSLPDNITVTGGLSGDGSRFEQTLVCVNGEAVSGRVAALGLYGDRLKVGYASLGGWDTFGPERLITKSINNVLFEMDGKSALDLYKTYLGEHAEGLPATGLLFPLSLSTQESNTRVVRTLLAVDEETQSMTFAGDVPEGSRAQLMRANFDRLIDGAAGAAKNSYNLIGESPTDLAILISCVGRKLVLGQRIEEEVEAVQDVLVGDPVITGFYSYGEISPFTPSAKCELHNQTMTITTLTEV